MQLYYTQPNDKLEILTVLQNIVQIKFPFVDEPL